MNNIATISMQNGQITLPSAGLMAQRLENFEIALRDRMIADCDQQIKDLILVCNDHITTNKKLTAAHALLQIANQNQSDFISELERAGNQLADEREQLRAEVERLVVQSVARDKALKKAQLQLSTSEDTLKKLRALEPERQKARIDRLKRNSDIRKQAISDLRISNRQFSEKNRALNIEVNKLNLALDKAIADINAGNMMEPIRVVNPPRLGSWEIFGTNAVGTYCVMDVERQTNQNVTVTDDGVDIPNVRPVPKAVQAAVEKLHKELLLNSLPATRQGE